VAKRTPRERLVSKAELMERSGASYVTILRDIERGRLAPPRMIGNNVVAWKESEVLAYFDALPPSCFAKRLAAKRLAAKRAGERAA
jgi:predicted DNA-binding transcriptional regulator AlpA